MLKISKLLAAGSLGAILLSSALATSAHADDVSQAGRKVIDVWKSSVVTVQVVVKMSESMDGKEGSSEENKSDATGLVIDPSGLVVTSLSATDPADMIRRMMGDMGKYNVSSQVTGVKIINAAGEELPAKIVLRDKDRDIIFIRPIQNPSSPMQAADLTKPGKPEILDEVVTLRRMGKVNRRGLGADIMRINAVITVPRLYYIPSSVVESSPGSSVFSMDGNLVGLVVMKFGSNGSAGRASMMGSSDDMSSVIVLPTDDISEAAKQAMAQK